MEIAEPKMFEFDPKFYRDFYKADPNIAIMDDAQILEHYAQYGIHEHRFVSGDHLVASLELRHGPLPADFDEKFYMEEYADVKSAACYARFGAAHYIMHGREEGRRHLPVTYEKSYLNLTLNRIYDLPEVEIDENRQPHINVLVPAFDFSSMSAGFFGVFQVARFIKSCGFNVRLVMFDNFYWNEAEFRERLAGYPGMEALFDELEIAYIGERRAPLKVSPHDNCVATVWYSAHFASKIMNVIGGRPFLYLIQDYETAFFPGSSWSALADATYSMNFNALFSTKTLMNFFLERGIGVFGKTAPSYIYFNNACASTLVPEDRFLAVSGNKRRLALYSRPVVNRNMFELAALSLCIAVERGIFDEGEWEFIGIGLGKSMIKLSETKTLFQFPRMNLREYQDAVAQFDIGLSLMASPHPSIVPFDLAGSGAVVVTNTFETKQQDYFDDICSNIIAAAPAVDAIVDGLAQAVSRVDDRRARYHAAREMAYPRDWSETFSDKHISFVQSIFQGAEVR